MSFTDQLLAELQAERERCARWKARAKSSRKSYARAVEEAHQALRAAKENGYQVIATEDKLRRTEAQRDAENYYRRQAKKAQADTHGQLVEAEAQYDKVVASLREVERERDHARALLDRWEDEHAKNEPVGPEVGEPGGPRNGATMDCGCWWYAPAVSEEGVTWGSCPNHGRIRMAKANVEEPLLWPADSTHKWRLSSIPIPLTVVDEVAEVTDEQWAKLSSPFSRGPITAEPSALVPIRAGDIVRVQRPDEEGRLYEVVTVHTYFGETTPNMLTLKVAK